MLGVVNIKGCLFDKTPPFRNQSIIEFTQQALIYLEIAKEKNMSKLVNEIVREYKLKQAYKSIQRQKCKELDCKICKWKQVCKNIKQEE